MKKIFVMMFSVLLVAFLSSSFTHIEKAIDNDVGYSLTIDQNITVMPTIESPVVSGESYILLDRGVSVPLKYPNQEAITNININQNFLVCNIDNYRHEKSIGTNFEFPVKGVNLFACDLGNKQVQKINIV